MSSFQIPNRLLRTILSGKSSENILAGKYLFPPPSEDRLLRMLLHESDTSTHSIVDKIQKKIDDYPHEFSANDLLGSVQ